MGDSKYREDASYLVNLPRLDLEGMGRLSSFFLIIASNSLGLLLVFSTRAWYYREEEEEEDEEDDHHTLHTLSSLLWFPSWPVLG